jgi:hypothetical protein
VDRWHPLKNLCDDLKKLVERNHQYLKYARKKEIMRLQKQRLSQSVHKRKQEKASSSHKIIHIRRWQQFRQIKQWQKKGVPILQMAHQLGMSRNTVKKYLQLQEPPFRTSIFQVNIALFDAYIRGRIREEPIIERMQLYREIKEKGYNGARSTAYEHFHRYIKTAPRLRGVPRLPDLFYVPSKIAFLFLRKQTQMNNKEQKLLRDLCSRSPSC